MASDSYLEMLDFIHRENIKRFQTQLSAATDADSRAKVQNIIDNELANYKLQVSHRLPGEPST